MDLITGRQLPVSGLQFLGAFCLGAVFCQHQPPISPPPVPDFLRTDQAESRILGESLGGVEQVEQALEESWLQVVRPTAGEQKLTVRLLRTTRLDDGEAEVLALASRRKLLLVADDKEGRHVAEALGIAYVGTAGVLLEAYLRRRLTLAGLEDVLTDLTKVLWLSPTVFAAILKKAREAKQ